MRRRSWALAGAAALVAVTATGGVVITSGPKDATAAAQGSPANTVAVEKGELSSMVSVAGLLAYRARSDGSPYAAINQARGTYTRLPDAGDKVGCGDVVYRVDDDPVLLLCGTVPAYRGLHEGDTGNDVRQLNRNLRALGYDAGGGAFTAKTKRALKRLQHAKGAHATGALELGAAVVLPKAARISRVTGALGEAARPGAPVAQATSDTLEVRVSLEPSQQREVKPGEHAQITLPDNTVAKGTVARLGKVAQAAGKGDDAGSATVPASISLDAPRKAGGLDHAPVQVEIRTEGVQNALSVPVLALVGKSGGGFAVEVVRAGRRELVAVELGLFDTADGRVQVEGDIHEGEHVVVPSL